MAEVDVRALLHELEVHQIELEMQNEELLRSQESSQEVTDKYQDLFDFAPTGYFLLDGDGWILEVNLAGAALLGLDRSTAVKRRFGQYVAAHFRDQFEQFCDDVLRSDSKQTREIEVLRNAHRVCVLLEGIRTHDGGKKRSFRVAVTDITERRRLEEADRRLASIVESSEDAIITKTLSGKVLTWNAAAERMYGYAAEEIVGTSIAILIPPERPDELPQILARIARGQRIAHYETDRMKKDGRRVPVSLAISPLVDASGRIWGASAIARDITDWKQAEQATADAKLSAEQANRGKDDFLAVLSHELRTPLTPVVLGVSMLQTRPDLAPEVREVLEMVRRNVEMEVRLVDDLLDVTRIARGKIQLSRSLVDLCTVIHSAVEVCKPDIQARGLGFVVDLGPGTPYWIEADVSRLEQVFWSLLRNAVEFTPNGGCVAIRCRPNEKHVVVEVNDSGIGIEPEALPRVFDAFEQVDRSITPQFGGLGLGLTISKALVEMHGGTIEVRSEGKGKGATFGIRLPLTAPMSQPAARVPTTSQDQAVPPLCILLVEDHGVTAKMMRM
ncbi:MAG: sensor histidine kinase, partial [Thermoguttaceae bacterium]